ncbi:MAG: 50S ribosomal protein L23 [Nitrospinae bacterium]|nr:50S ribosomal protein L23 [Nitrospinota bacterium]
MKNEHFDVIRSPLLTEKATDLREKFNQICFEVDPRANKKQVSDAVEKIFNVKVAAVKIVNTKPKPKRLGKYSGSSTGYKKAVVSLKEGSRIEIFERVS